MISFLVFAFGLAVGSFLNSVIFRMEQGTSVLQGRSSCPHCAHILAWYDLIPLASFFLLRGKCRYCKQKISWQYPLVELATASLFVLVFWHLSLGLDWSLVISHWSLVRLAYLWIISALFIVIFVYDLKHFIIPDRFVYPAIGITFAYRILEFLSFGNWDLFRISDFGFRISAPLTQSIITAIGAALFFFALYALSRGAAMGFGDVKLAFFMGLFLGWPNILVALFFAFLAGACVGVFLVLLKRRGWKSQVPFGPFLVSGTFAALFFGENMVAWYLDVLGV